ncbi:Uncharacterised protein [Actinomyces denticolens]|nr:Uncharacterised protein [Actinomyces denticolens]
MHKDVNLPVKNTDTFYAFEQDVRKNPHEYRDIRIEVRYADPDIASPTGTLKGLDPASRVPEEFDVSWTNAENLPDRSVFPNEAVPDDGSR